jgi:hypothetical protein
MSGHTLHSEALNDLDEIRAYRLDKQGARQF